MKTVILPGGLPHRTGEETSVGPKPMIAIAGKPTMANSVIAPGDESCGVRFVCSTVTRLRSTPFRMEYNLEPRLAHTVANTRATLATEGAG